jgi:hypothetical protein
LIYKVVPQVKGEAGQPFLVLPEAARIRTMASLKRCGQLASQFGGSVATEQKGCSFKYVEVRPELAEGGKIKDPHLLTVLEELVTVTLIDDGLLIKQADGSLQDPHGQAWKFPAQRKGKGDRGGTMSRLQLSRLQLAHLAIMMLCCCGVC